MNYQLYFQDGYYKIRNNLGQTCCAQMGKHVTERKFVGSQQAAKFFSDFLIGRSMPFFPTVWVEPKQIPAKPVSTVVSGAHKPVHGGYPDTRYPGRLFAFSARYGTTTGRHGTAVSHIEELDRMASAGNAHWATIKGRADPLVWPVIPQADDGSNEEATTVPDALVAALSKRQFVILIRR